MTKHTHALVGKPQWWKHLREWKRVFWKRERRAAHDEAQRIASCNAELVTLQALRWVRVRRKLPPLRLVSRR